MDNPVLLPIIAGLGVIFGFVICTIMFRSDRANILARGKAEGDKEKAALEERVNAKEQRIVEVLKEREHERTTIEKLREEASRCRIAAAEAEARLADSQRFAEEKLALLHDAQHKLADTFKALSSDALQRNNQSFLDLARTHLEKFQEGAQHDLDTRTKAIDDMVRPVKDALTQVERSITDLEKSRVDAYAGLTQQVRSLLETQAQLRTETTTLVNALRTPHVRGRWGEVQLRRVVELAGMVQHCDFQLQPTVATDDGTLRPDMLIRLPNNRTIVVDAKAPLSAYLESLDAPDDATRAEKQRQHAVQVRTHLTQLSAKKYWNQFTEAPEFAVLFLPAEPFFSAALEHDPSLIEFGAEQGVILATPTTLIALLKAVAYGWQQQRLADNAREVIELGQSLYDRLLTFTSYIDDVRKNLNRTVESYNKAAGSLESRVLVGARRFKELGAAAGDDLPSIEPVDALPRDLRALEQAAAQSFDDLPEQLTLEPVADAEPEPQPAEEPLSPEIPEFVRG